MKHTIVLLATAIAVIACSSESPAKKNQEVRVSASAPLKVQAACPPACDCRDANPDGTMGPWYACTCDADFNCVAID